MSEITKKQREKRSRIVVAGEVPLGLFHLPANQAKVENETSGKRVTFDATALFPVRLGAAYVFAAADAILKKENERKRVIFWHKQSKVAWEESKIADRMFTLKAEQGLPNCPPCLRIVDEFQPLKVFGYEQRDRIPHNAIVNNVREHDVLVNWFRHPEEKKPSGFIVHKPSVCKFHIQIGGLHRVAPTSLALPRSARLIVTSLYEASYKHRIRKGLSYEAMAIDFLRALRGGQGAPGWKEKKTFEDRMFPALYDKNENFSADYENHTPCFPENLGTTGFEGTRGVPTFLVVRFSNSAAMIYWIETDANARFKDRAWFFFHKDRPAPIDTPNLGRMQGYTGFLGAHLALGARLQNECELDKVGGNLNKHWIGWAIKDSLVLQTKLFNQGFFRMFFQTRKTEDGKWNSTALEDSLWSEKRCEFLTNLLPESEGARTKERNDVSALEIDIAEAVSYRKHWFMAKDMIAMPGTTAANILGRAQKQFVKLRPGVKFRADETTLSRSFREQGIYWLSTPSARPEFDVPVTKIGDLALVDRAEIEDYLAIQAALQQYCDNDHPKPLNIGVFGAPGAGKSFGVTQVAEHIRKTTGKIGRKLSFNLSQITTLEHLMTAFHQIRNECLSGEIPLVFFDEFDSAFEGRPFGWFKYFLAPMQDGEFIENGVSHRIGRSIFVFAGGVNRTFEELNSRARNITFVEAKGPDFISRLRGHLNIRGINKPDDEHDQGRYLLRRAVLLYGIAVKMLEHKGNQLLPRDGLLARNVARAFLTLARYKHGVRSMESILGMCDFDRGRTVVASDLPTKKQLDMHVDASEFLMALRNNDDELQ